MRDERPHPDCRNSRINQVMTNLDLNGKAHTHTPAQRSVELSGKHTQESCYQGFQLAKQSSLSSQREACKDEASTIPEGCQKGVFFCFQKAPLALAGWLGCINGGVPVPPTVGTNSVRLAADWFDSPTEKDIYYTFNSKPLDEHYNPSANPHHYYYYYYPARRPACNGSQLLTTPTSPTSRPKQAIDTKEPTNATDWIAILDRVTKRTQHSGFEERRH